MENTTQPSTQEIATQIAIEQRNEQANRCVDLAVQLTLERKKVAALEATIAEMNAPKADAAIAALTDFTPPT